MAGAALVGGLFAILLFTVLPTVLVGGLGKVVTLTRWPRVILEAVLKVAIFLSYMVAISKMKEIHRVFEYHGAEHKTIACYEACLLYTSRAARETASCALIVPSVQTSMVSLS